ncbi:MAG: 1-(5-phosphoribosyl)-5-[(5-phosphoribosylamino)methylideneamino] imidazole-4-carboxamide isomerase [Candidatus Dormibacteria bacterium]|jgi:phosphoribosylformimino-5-aminoimidazole carboxamide ribotide isomerase
MIVIPAIDIRGGRCVRLIQGDYNREHVYESDPAGVARRLVESGAHRIHLVDLDAARGLADLDSAAAARGVLEAARQGGVEIEVGGGVRTLAAAERWLAAGATLVVLGSVAVREPDAAEAICAALPGRCLVSLDVRGDVAQAEGWTEGAGSAAAHLERWATWPLAGLVRTEVSLDGMLNGPDLAGLEETVRSFPGPVIASGGISTVDDIARCDEAGAAGAIVGRALYEGSFDLRAAILRFPR